MKKSSSLTSPFQLLALAFKEAGRDNVPRLGAALAFYAILSLAPLLVMIIAIVDRIWNQANAQGRIVSQLSIWLGESSALTLQAMMNAVMLPMGSGLTAVIAGIGLFLAATAVLEELTRGLNTVWGVTTNGGIKVLVFRRTRGFGMLSGLGILVLVSLAINAFLSAMGSYFQGWLPFSEHTLQVIHLLVSLGVMIMIFIGLHKWLPDTRITWRQAALAAVVTAPLFAIANLIVGLYIGREGFQSSYGAAGAFVAILIWVYISAQIFYFGAEVAKASTLLSRPSSAR